MNRKLEHGRPTLRLYVLQGGLWLMALAITPHLFAGELVIDPKQSHVLVAVKATGDDFVGELQKYEAQIALEEKSLRPERAVFGWDFKDLMTGNEKRDKAMLKWLEHPKLPKATFTFQRWEEKDGKTMAVGEMELHGVKKSMTFPVQISRQGENVVVHGDAQMDHRDFNLKIITMMLFFKVDPQLKVSFDLHGRFRSETAQP